MRLVGLALSASAVRSAAAVAVVLLAAGCASTSPFTEDTFPASPGHLGRFVTIGSGAAGPDRWTMRAAVNGEGQLCLGVDWTPAGQPNEDGCGFGAGVLNDEGRGYEPTTSTTSAHGAVLVYGPAPSRTVTATLFTSVIRGTDCTTRTLTPTTVPVTGMLPSWYAVPGRWFAARVAMSDSSCPVDVTFRDAQGRTLTQRKNY